MGVVAHHAQKLIERLPRQNTTARAPAQIGHHALELPARKIRESRMTVWRNARAAHKGRCASIGLPPGAARRTRVQKAPLVAVASQRGLAGRQFTLRRQSEHANLCTSKRAAKDSERFQATAKSAYASQAPSLKPSTFDGRGRVKTRAII
jgi:hypothetical protein